MPVYNKNITTSSSNKSKHYLMTCLDQVREIILLRNMEKEITENEADHQKFELEKRMMNMIEEKKKLKPRQKNQNKDLDNVTNEGKNPRHSIFASKLMILSQKSQMTMCHLKIQNYTLVLSSLM